MDVGGVDERDDGVEDGAVVVEEFVVDPEFLRDGTGIGEAGGLEEDEVELAPGRRAALEQVVDGLDEAAFDGAAHAAVVHLHPFLHRGVAVGLVLHEHLLHAELGAELVQDDRDAVAVVGVQHVVHERRLAGAEHAGHDRDSRRCHRDRGRRRGRRRRRHN